MDGQAAAAKARELLERAQGAGLDDARAIVRELLPALLEAALGLDRDERDAFARDTGSLVPAVGLALSYAVRDVRRLVADSAEHNRWDRVAAARSRLEAVRDLYGSGPAASELPDLSELDDLIRDEAPAQNGLDPGDVPDGIPSSHWWWWAPEDPPTS